MGRDSRRPATQVAIRALGARDLAIGLGIAIALDRGAPVRGWLEGAALSDAIDTVASLLAALGRTPTAAPETAVETLATIWTRTLYGAR